MNPHPPTRWNLDLSEAIPLMRGGPGHFLQKPAEDLLRLTAMNRFLRDLNPAADATTIFQRALDLLALRYRRMMTRYMGAAGWREFCQMHSAHGRKSKANPALAD